MNNNTKNFGTAPVFFTAISTIPGAILFLRFGFAVGTHGFWVVILMILLSFIISGQFDWRKRHIQIFDICHPKKNYLIHKKMKGLVNSGRLPITAKNIKIIKQEPNISAKSIINIYSENAGLTLIGIHLELVKLEKEKLFEGYEQLGTTLFVHSKNQKQIE